MRGSSSVLPVLGLLSVWIGCGGAQPIPPPECSCSFDRFRFRLDFSLSCPPVNVTAGDAVSSSNCLTAPLDNPMVMDLIPVRVEEVQILELNYRLEVIKAENISRDFRDGDEYVYESIVASQDITAPEDLPVVLQGILTGTNRFDQALRQSWGIQFTNRCDVYPILPVGSDVGWSEFIGGQGGNFEFCNAAPTASPTFLPTFSPTSSPTSQPTSSPTSRPTSSPTSRPTSTSTTSPTSPPTTAPTRRPTSGPTSAPTSQPTSGPTSMPSMTSPAPSLLPTTMSMNLGIGDLEDPLMDEFGDDGGDDGSGGDDSNGGGGSGQQGGSQGSGGLLQKKDKVLTHKDLNKLTKNPASANAAVKNRRTAAGAAKKRQTSSTGTAKRRATSRGEQKIVKARNRDLYQLS